MSINIPALVGEAKAVALADPRHLMIETIVRFTAHRIIEECMREVRAVADCDAAKEQINARLLKLAEEVRL